MWECCPIFDISLQELLKAMTGELEAQRYYSELIKLTNDPQEKEIINMIINDEKKHFLSFRNLYIAITGVEPPIPEIPTPKIENFVAGVEKSILDELEAYEFYKTVYISTSNLHVKDIFFQAFTDEIEHAIYFNYFYTKNK